MTTTTTQTQNKNRNFFIAAGVGLIVAVLLLFSLAGELFVHVDAGEKVVVQYPNGKLAVISTPGSFNPRWFGTVERFPRSAQFWFSSKKDEGKETDESIKTRFNDGAHGYISGSIRFDYPESETNFLDLYKTYRTADAVSKQLVGQCMTKAIYMTGPLMSSKESYSDRRNELINDIEDQAINGVYKTTSTQVEIEDPITQTKKWVNAVKIDIDPKTGQPQRQEISPLLRFGIKPYNLNINEVKYDPVVESQIAAQQQAIMQVQTAIAKSKEAEQEKLTTVAKGEANAATAKWEQEVIKAKAVTEAEQEALVQKTNAERDKIVAETKAQQELNVAKLAREAAEETKQRDIAIGEGQAAAKKLAMEANGALELKLDAWVKAQTAWADGLSKYKGNITPAVVTGGGGTNASNNGFEQFMSILSAKQAKDLSLELNTSPNK
jgi:SPFH domain / Band 7 family